MCFGTIKANRVLQFVFISLTILFFFLTAKSALLAYDPIMNLTWFTRMTGFEGIFCGGSAVYLALAEVLNEAHGKTVLPIWPTS
jgi:succinate-acetate transporter protein